MGVDMQHLRCVVAITDHGTFTDAAAALHMSQPALSHAIARLERELGARLFDRTASGARLTAAGRALIDPARRSLAEAELGKAAVIATTGVVGGDLRAVSVRTAVVETSRLLGAFSARHPQVRLSVDEPTGGYGVVDLVRGGRCDVGIIRTPDAPSDLVRVPAGAQEMVVLYPSSLAPATTAIDVETLAATQVIAPMAGTPARSAHDAFFRAEGQRPDIVAEAAHQMSLIELVRAGVGAALMSEAIARSVEPTGLEVRRLRHGRPVMELSAIRLSNASPATEAFCDLVAELTVAPRSLRRNRRVSSS